MPKLNQILAIEKQTKASASADLTGVYHQLQKEALLNGVSRTYAAKDDDGERFPSESQIVQLNVAKLLDSVSKSLTPLYSVTAQRDIANCSAQADVIVDGVTILTAVPATHLLWLEKQFIDLHTLISKLPALPQTESWTYDSGQSCWKTAPVETAKTKRDPQGVRESACHCRASGSGRRGARGRDPRLLDHGEVLGRAAQGPNPNPTRAH